MGGLDLGVLGPNHGSELLGEVLLEGLTVNADRLGLAPVSAAVRIPSGFEPVRVAFTEIHARWSEATAEPESSTSSP